MAREIPWHRALKEIGTDWDTRDCSKYFEMKNKDLYINLKLVKTILFERFTGKVWCYPVEARSGPYLSSSHAKTQAKGRLSCSLSCSCCRRAKKQRNQQKQTRPNQSKQASKHLWLVFAHPDVHMCSSLRNARVLFKGPGLLLPWYPRFAKFGQLSSIF